MINQEEIEKIITDTLGISLDLTGNNFAVVEFYSISPGLFGNGKCQKESTNVQIDIYYMYKIERDEAAKKLHEKLKCMNEITYPFLEVNYDDMAERYRATFSFTII